MLLLFFFILPTLIAARHGARIIGGEPAKDNEYPFMVAIYTSTHNGTFFCGGSLINKQWIVTAGQCVSGGLSFNISLGSVDLKKPTLSLITDTFYLHPEYNPTTLENDIGIIKLQEWISFTEDVSSISYMSTGYVTPEIQVVTLGWGQTSDDNEDLVDTLQWVPLRAIWNDECKQTYGNQITENMVCMVGAGNAGSCHGDTGGPLVRNVAGTVMLVGVASFVSGNGCENGDPSGFTRVDPYTMWLWKHVNDFSL